MVAGVFAFFLLAFAGIPLTSGFTGKWAVFTSAWSGGACAIIVRWRSLKKTALITPMLAV